MANQIQVFLILCIYDRDIDSIIGIGNRQGSLLFYKAPSAKKLKTLLLGYQELDQRKDRATYLSETREITLKIGDDKR